jgi:hypothetical protein
MPCFAGIVPRITLALLAAWLVLRLLPLSHMVDNPAQLSPSVYRAVLFCWIAMASGFILVGIPAAVMWRRLSKLQARAYVLRVLTEELGRERTSLVRAIRRRGRGWRMRRQS